MELVNILLSQGLDITRTFIMLEDSNIPNSKILATMPGQNFTTNITSTEFSAFDWYQKAIGNTSQLILIHKQEDPFKGGIDLALGYVMGFKTGNLRGAFGVHFNTDAMKGLLNPLIYRISGTNDTQ